MIQLRPWCALFTVVALTSILQAEDKPASPWAVDRSLSVSPRGAPVPTFKYRLMPLSSELKEGNAVPIYLRLIHEQSDASRTYWTETPKPWNSLPVDRVPLEEARKFLEGRSRFLRQFELGARRRTAEWSYTLDEGDPIGILLPDVQIMRNYAPMLLLQVRVALADGDFARAAHDLETGFGFTRHVADGPFLIHSLVAVALASQFAGTVADFVERPDAPNLYWALTALPHPFIDLRHGMDLEYRLLEWIFPELDELDRERSPEQWDRALRRVRTELRKVSMEGTPPKLPDWYPKGCAPEDPAATSPDLPAARAYVARLKRLRAEQAEALPPAQVLMLYFVGTYHEYRDMIFQAAYLPYPRARSLFETAIQKVRATPPRSEGHVAARAFLPALGKVMGAQVRIERNLAALRTIEALRLHAAAHEGKLPDKLSDLTEVPVPDDPGTGQAFEYTRDGDTATLTSQIPGDPLPSNGIRYRVTIRKK